MPGGRLYTPRKKLVGELKSYGEDQVARKIRGMSNDDYDRLQQVAFVHSLTSMLLAKALCLAAVEVVEGKPRPLKRKRRVFPKSEH